MLKNIRGMLAAAIAVAVLSTVGVSVSASGAPAVASGKIHLVDINSASRDTLAKLPGIGEVYAAKIVRGRPYRVKSELKSRGILPPATYAKIHNRIIARQ